MRSMFLIVFFLLTGVVNGQQGAVITQTLEYPGGGVGNIDFPVALHMKNTVGTDGSGLCVFTSIQMAARWHSVFHIANSFQDYMRKRTGGGYPRKVDQMIAEFCRDEQIKPPDYMQDTTGNIDLLATATNLGYFPGITYCWSPVGRYGGKIIAHMVNCVAARCGPNKDMWAILDNNYPGTYEWMHERDFVRAFKGNQGGWMFLFLAPPPPPPPINLAYQLHDVEYQSTLSNGTNDSDSNTMHLVMIDRSLITNPYRYRRKS